MAVEVCLRVIETYTGKLPDELTLAAVEPERRKAVDALPRLLASEVSGSHWLRVQLRALQALASGEGCPCEAYKRSGQERVGPHMSCTEKLDDPKSWTFVNRGTCDLCGEPWELRFEHRGRGGNLIEWD